MKKKKDQRSELSLVLTQSAKVLPGTSKEAVKMKHGCRMKILHLSWPARQRRLWDDVHWGRCAVVWRDHHELR